MHPPQAALVSRRHCRSAYQSDQINRDPSAVSDDFSTVEAGSKFVRADLLRFCHSLWGTDSARQPLYDALEVDRSTDRCALAFVASCQESSRCNSVRVADSTQ